MLQLAHDLTHGPGTDGPGAPAAADALVAGARCQQSAEERMALLREALLLEPGHAVASKALAGLLLGEGVASARAGDTGRARALLRELAGLTPGDERVWLWRSTVAQDLAEALQCVTRVLEIAPDHPRGLAAMAKLRERAAQTSGTNPGAPADGRSLGQSAPAIGSAGPETFVPATSGPTPLPAAQVRDIASFPLGGVAGEPADTAAGQPALGRLEVSPGEPVRPAVPSPPREEGRARTTNPIGFRPPADAASRTQAARLGEAPETLPASAPRPRDDTREAPVAAPSRGLVLVVDDSPAVLKAVEFELRQRRIEVMVEPGGADALVRLASVRPDVVLVDADMPAMDGYELCRGIRADHRSRHLPVVLMSPRQGFAEKVRCRLAGASGSITKPLEFETLVRVLEPHLPVGRGRGSL